MDKYEIASVFRDLSFLIELTDPYPKKAIAYKKAASIIESIEDFEKEVQSKSLTSYQGIGEKISEMITQLVEKGSLKYYDELVKKIPKTLVELCYVPGLNPQKIRFLFETYKITNIEELRNLLESDEKIKGFGPVYRKKILDKLTFFETHYSLLYPNALKIAENLVNILSSLAEKISIVGDLRRKLETISEINLLMVSQEVSRCLEKLETYTLLKEIIKSSDEEFIALLKNGIKFSINFVSFEEFPFYELFLTGNEKHFKQLQKQALKQQFHLNKNNLVKKNKIIHLNKEKEIYTNLGLNYIPPELREGLGEVDFYKSIRELSLLEPQDIKGVFHCHTIYSDGGETIESMAEAAKNLGWNYIGITDHSKSSYQAHGMDENRLFEQISEIKRLNKKSNDNTFYIFSGIECDILKDGQLDFSNEILNELDFVIISIHRYFNMEEKEMTKRMIKAIENPYSTIVGHLTGRLLRYRNSYAINVPKIIDACISNGKIIEINAYPNRLDMDWRWWVKAKEKRLKCMINPDAHAAYQLEYYKYGVNVARKGWLEKEDVINTLSLKKLKEFLKSKKLK